MTELGTRPLVGMTTYSERARFGWWDTSTAALPNNYVTSVTAAGGLPTLLPPPFAADRSSADRPELDRLARSAAAGLDALVIVGGEDVDASLFDQEPGPETGTPSPHRDRWELALIEAALEAPLPLLGVCRGAQLLNIHLGGSLQQHLPDVVGHRGHQPAPGQFSSNLVKTEPGSQLELIVGPSSQVQCSHHQAIDEVGRGLAVVARAADGTIEAVELQGDRFCLGVQWHPEVGADKALFEALVDAALAHGVPSG